MTKTALSVYMFGLYMVIGVGVPFALVPHIALSVLGLATADDMWIRMLGLFVTIMGVFYILAVAHDVKAFFPWTVPARYASAAFMSVMVAMGKVGAALLIAAAIDAIAASLTWLALRAEAGRPAATPAP